MTTYLVRTDDDGAYAYMMTRQPVRGTAPAQRPHLSTGASASVAAWDLLFLKKVLSVDPLRARTGIAGAYLAEASAIAVPATAAIHWGRTARHAFSGGEAEVGRLCDQRNRRADSLGQRRLVLLRHGFHPRMGLARTDAEVTGICRPGRDRTWPAMRLCRQPDGQPSPERQQQARNCGRMCRMETLAVPASSDSKQCLTMRRMAAPRSSRRLAIAMRAAAPALRGRLRFSTASNAPDPQNIIMS